MVPKTPSKGTLVAARIALAKSVVTALQAQREQGPSAIAGQAREEGDVAVVVEVIAAVDVEDAGLDVGVADPVPDGVVKA